MNWQVSMNHSCEIKENAGAMLPLATKTEIEIFIKENVEYHSGFVNMTPEMIYNTLLISLARKFTDYIYAPPLKSDIKAMVKRLRGSNTPNLYRLREAPLCNTIAGFSLYNRMISVTYGKKEINSIFWSNTEGLNLLQQSDHMFIDGTFKVVPKPFKQLLIIMGHHKYTRTFFPACFILMDSKSKEAYEMVFNVFKSWLPYESRLPTRATTDFEIGLINSLNKSLPWISDMVGCYFHFKQAINRKLKELGAGKNTEYLTYLAGTLTLVTKSEIHLVFDYMETKALQKNEPLRTVVEEFRVYFEEFWMPKFDFWNVSRFECSFGNLKRTNNCLERYNRRLNDKFPLAHPSITQFASVIQQEKCYYSQLIRSIQVGVQLEEEVFRM
jgi:hypothetical protein